MTTHWFTWARQSGRHREELSDCAEKVANFVTEWWTEEEDRAAACSDSFAHINQTFVLGLVWPPEAVTRTMKLSGNVLDLDSTDYSTTLDPSYTMLEFDNLRVFPVETGTSGIMTPLPVCLSLIDWCTTIPKHWSDIWGRVFVWYSKDIQII